MFFGYGSSNLISSPFESSIFLITLISSPFESDERELELDELEDELELETELELELKLNESERIKLICQNESDSPF